MIFQTHDLIHPNQTRLNKLIESYDRAYLYAQNKPQSRYDLPQTKVSTIDVYDILEYRTAYNSVH